jgi:hypothetical protein
MLCRVESYSGFRLHERPRRFTWEETWLTIDRIVEQWMTPSSYCFKVKVDDRVFRLEYHPSRDVWEADLISP